MRAKTFPKLEVIHMTKTKLTDKGAIAIFNGELTPHPPPHTLHSPSIHPRFTLYTFCLNIPTCSSWRRDAL